MEKIKITAIIKTSNSEKTICDTLEALSYVDEIIVIDEHSKDDTVEILKEYKAKTLFSTKGEFLSGFTAAIEESKNDWIIALEDDEIIPKKTLDNINDYILKSEKKPEKKRCHCISLNRKFFYLNDELKFALDKKLIRVFKKGFIKLEDNNGFNLKPLKTKVHHLKKDYPILKYNKNSISENISDMLEKNILKLKITKQKKASVFIKPFMEFINIYFLKGAMFNKFGLIYSMNKMLERYIFEVMLYEKQEIRGKEYDI